MVSYHFVKTTTEKMYFMMFYCSRIARQEMCSPVCMYVKTLSIFQITLVWFKHFIAKFDYLYVSDSRILGTADYCHNHPAVDIYDVTTCRLSIKTQFNSVQTQFSLFVKFASSKVQGSFLNSAIVNKLFIC